MTEEIKPIVEEEPVLPKINQNEVKTINEKIESIDNNQVISELPSWSIEPPIEIKRGS